MRYIVLVSLFFVIGCDASPKTKVVEKYTELRVLMGTTVRLDTCSDEHDEPKLRQSYKKVWQRLGEISWRMNVMDKRSDVAKVNGSYQKPVTIEPDTYQLLKSSKDLSLLTSGAFDITVWPLIELWRESKEQEILPDQKDLEKIRSALGAENIKLLANDQVTLLNPLTKIDLGGIAKGYAVDEAARIFREEGVANFFIDAGGDIYAGGRNCQRQPWRVGIRDPRRRTDFVDVVAIENLAVTTSGDYEQYYEINDQKWSHIIDPITGYPQKDVVSATVIAPKAMTADALSTALCILGDQKAIALIESLDGPHASLVLRRQDDERLIRFESKGYKSFQATKF